MMAASLFEVCCRRLWPLPQGMAASFLGGKRVKGVAFRFLHLYTYMYKNKYLKAWWLEK